MIELYKPELFEIVESLAKEMLDESEFSRRDWNPDKLRHLLSRGDVFCAIVRNDEGQYIGGIMGMISIQFFGDDLVARDLGIYVHPEFRGGTAAVRLIKSFEAWAISNGAKEIYLSQSTGVNVEKTRDLYEKLGYHTVGYLTKKEI